MLVAAQAPVPFFEALRVRRGLMLALPFLALPPKAARTYSERRHTMRLSELRRGPRRTRRRRAQMIHFTYRHCKKSVRVDDRFGGKLGRCPHCKQTVTIPAPDPLSALAAAVEPKSPDDTDAFVPPPPGVGRDHASAAAEEITLPGDTDVDLADTVILPAGTFDEKPDEPQPAPPPHPTGRLERHRPALNAVRTVLILVAIVVVLIVAVLAAALAGLL